METERLIIRVSARGEMESFIGLQTDEILKAAFSEMLDGCLKHPDEREWYALWMAELKDGTHVGELCFRGIDDNGTAEIGYGISEEYRGRGYATEAVCALTQWTLERPGVLRVEAETGDDNTASKRVLEKSGYLPSGKRGEEGPRFIRVRKKPSRD